MEFPSAGTQCSVKNCKQLDFLPFTCNYCQIIFCKEHFPTASHCCSKFNDNVLDDTKLNTIATVECSQQDCVSRSVVAMPCVKCNKHFCLSHRHHGCFEPTELQRLNDLEKWEKPKHQFLEAKNAVDKEVANKLRKSKNSATAIKVQLMKLKGKSVGPNNIPISERCYFLVHLPVTNEATKTSESSKGVFVSATWSIGKVIDSISDSLNVPNLNNQANAKKLRMYNYFTGAIVTNKMDRLLNEFLNDKNLVNGQDVILEYSENETLDRSLYN